MQLSDISPEGRSRSQPMNAEQFSAYAAKGQSTLDQMSKAAPRSSNGVYTAPGAVSSAYQAAKPEWGGATLDPTGKALSPSPDSYAVSAKAPGQSSVTVPAHVSEEQFGQAYNQAKKTFRPQMKAGASIGVFHNAEANQIEFDPSHVVQGEETAKQVGAATNATGGAYHFGSGNGVFPPHVE